MWLMASANMWATEMYLILSHLTPGLAGMVSRKMTSSSTLSVDAVDGRAGEDAVAGAGGHILGAADLHQGLEPRGTGSRPYPPYRPAG